MIDDRPSFTGPRRRLTMMVPVVVPTGTKNGVVAPVTALFCVPERLKTPVTVLKIIPWSTKASPLNRLITLLLSVTLDGPATDENKIPVPLETLSTIKLSKILTLADSARMKSIPVPLAPLNVTEFAPIDS